MKLATLVVAITLNVFAQANQASIIGVVSDPSARLVQNAQVDAKNIETGQQFSAQSNDTGHYRLTGLPAGTYEVSITLPHFQEVRVTGVKAPDLQPARVDLILKTK
jgi:hypothetical protein